MKQAAQEQRCEKQECEEDHHEDDFFRFLSSRPDILASEVCQPDGTRRDS